MSDPTIRLKRSSVEGKIPTTAQLLIGELAVNSFDGQVFLKQDTGGVGIATRVIAVGAGGSLGKTVFVTKSGNDNNTGLNERDAKATIGAAATIAESFDTIKVYPGQYVENNPIVLKKNVSVEGLELRNCLVTAQNVDKDLFHVNDGVHVTDLSFVGPAMTDGAAVIAFRPLTGVSPDRYFDAARMIRYNSDFIAREAVGFLTSGYSGYAGTHVAQDAAVLLEANLDFIANEAVGYLTSTDYKSPVFEVPTTDQDCRDDIKDIFKAIAYDLKATGNEKSVGAALSYFSSAGALLHITGTDINGYGISTATVDTINYAVGIATYVINNKPYGSVASGTTTNITGFVYDNLTGLSTVTAVGHGVTTGDIIKLDGVKFTCPGGSGITTNTFPDGKYGYFFKVEEYVGVNTFKVYVGISSIPHTYDTGGTVEEYTSYQSTYTQAFDPTRIQTRVEYDQAGNKYVRGTGWCVGVANSITYLAGIVTTAVGSGSTAGITTVTGINLDTFKCSRDVRNIWKAVCYDITRGGNKKCVAAGKTYFDESTGEFAINTLHSGAEREQTIAALDYSLGIARCVVNNATWGGVSIGLTIPVTNIIYDSRTGLSTITSADHGLQKYDAIKLDGLGFKCPEGSPGLNISVVGGDYDRITGITTIETSDAHGLRSGNSVRLRNLVYECDSGGGPSTAYFPDGHLGYDFIVEDAPSTTTFVVRVGLSTIDHTYIGGGTATRLYTPTVGVSSALYDNVTGLTTVYHTTSTSGSSDNTPQYIEPGQKIKLENLAFECNSGGGIGTLFYPSGNLGYEFDVIRTASNREFDASNLIAGNKLEIIDKSLAAIAISHPDFYFPGDDQTTQYSRYKDAYRLIQQNRDEIVTTAWDNMIANPANSGVVGTENKCKRDIGYFVDAVSTDIFTGGNNYTISFIKQYFDGAGNPISNGLVGEEVQSIDAFDQARDLMKQAVTNQLTVKDLTVSIGSSVYGDGNPSVGNSETYACSDVQTTLNTLTGIATEAIESANLDTVNSITINYGAFQTSEAKCRRDINYIVDALITDVRTASNKNIREATRAYFDASGDPISNGLVGETAESVTAFNAVGSYAKKAIANQLNFRDLTITADPVTGVNTDPNSCADVQSTIDNLVGILTTYVAAGSLDGFPALSVSNYVVVNTGVSTVAHTFTTPTTLGITNYTKQVGILTGGSKDTNFDSPPVGSRFDIGSANKNGSTIFVRGHDYYNVGFGTAIKIVYVFDRSGDSFTEVGILTGTYSNYDFWFADPPFLSESPDHDFFGYAVNSNADGDLIFVSAPGAYLNGQGGIFSRNGVVYAYQRTGNTFTQVGILTGPGSAGSDGGFGTNDGFGRSSSVSDDGSTIAIGADSYNDWTGRVIIFSRDSENNFTGIATLTGSGTSKHFGRNVKLNSAGTKLLVSAPGETNEAYVYTRSGNTFTLSLTLSAPSGSTWFGGIPTATLAEEDNSIDISEDPEFYFIGDARGGPTYTGGASLGIIHIFDAGGNHVGIMTDGNTLGGTRGSAFGLNFNISEDSKYVFVKNGAEDPSDNLIDVNLLFEGNGSTFTQIGIVTTSGGGNTFLSKTENKLYASQSGLGTDSLKVLEVAKPTSNFGITTSIFPDGTFGTKFPVERVIDSNTFETTLGGTVIQHTYYGGGNILKFRPFQTINTQVKDFSIQEDPLVGSNQSPAGCRNVVSAMESCIGIVTTIVGSGLTAFKGAINPVGLTTRYEGNSGAGSDIENDPSFTPGTGQIFKGPYIRNCTNFVPDSIGMRIDGFPAEPGDEDDIGVQGSMSVDSYTQYNQGGIGVSISNGAYAQLVSIFTICSDQAIVTETGGQCDLTNSNSSFGRLGLVSRGVSDNNSKSIYRMTANVATAASVGDIDIEVSGVGTFRPYDGQVFYVGQLYYALNTITVTDGGSGYAYANDPSITIDAPTGPNGITAQAIPTVIDGRITEITLINSGTQYEYAPNITISAPAGGGTAATAEVSLLDPLYYKVAASSLPISGITTITSVQGLNNNVAIGDTVYLVRQSLQIASSHSFEYIGAGNNIFTARPSVGGVTIQENEVVKEDGGDVIYTSTDQAGNFRIGDGVVINQSSGTISGRTYLKSLFNNVTPFILALGD